MSISQNIQNQIDRTPKLANFRASQKVLLITVREGEGTVLFPSKLRQYVVDPATGETLGFISEKRWDAVESSTASTEDNSI